VPRIWRYQLARLCAVIAWQIQGYAIGWIIYDKTRDPWSLGLVGLAQFLPMLLLTVVGGLVADRLPRMRILAVGHVLLVANALLLAYAVAGARLWLVYLALGMIGVLRAFTAPASQAILPNLVTKDKFQSAVAVSSSVMSVATLCGPFAGGFAYQLFTHAPHQVFYTSAVLFGVALLLLLSVGQITVPSAEALPSAAPQGPLAQVQEGVRFVFANKIILGALSLDLFAVLFGGAVALLPVYARDILHAGPLGLSVLRAATPAGTLMTALILTRIKLKQHAGYIMFASVFVFGAATVAFGLFTSVLAATLALVIIGASDMVSMQVRQVLVQMHTPDAMRGRVGAVNMLFISASNELGEFESGFAATALGGGVLGSVRAVTSGGVLTCLVVAAWMKLFPELRKLSTLDKVG
jgi:MFS family permease